MANFYIKKYDSRNEIILTSEKINKIHYFYNPVTIDWENNSNWTSLNRAVSHISNKFFENYRIVTKKYPNR